MKFGLQGITFIFASGDSGVADISNQYCTFPQCLNGTYNNASLPGILNPTFPSAFPYVTSVGATQILPNSSIHDPEVAVFDYALSGGGFSNIFAKAKYQDSAIHSFYGNHEVEYPASTYNSRAVCGYPDVSVNGANYLNTIVGTLCTNFGTSASTVTFASIITLINNQRVAVGKKPVGLINPVLYANPGAFTDIMKGNNPGCGTEGWQAIEGWDPVTGLGTPIYSTLEEVFLALP